jgi:hypothetical protein
MADESGFEMVPVNSSQIEAVGFNPATGEGRVAFLAKGSRPGSLYSYPACTQDEFDQIVNGAIGGSVGVTFGNLWKYKSGYQRIG